MTLLKPTEPWAMTADKAAQRQGWASRSELALREALEAFARARWPDARVVHEIVMGEGRVRADVAAIGPAHIAAVEIKGRFDDTTRLLHQVAMYQLCVPEVWMVVDAKHGDDARLIRHLLPSIGLLTADSLGHRVVSAGTAVVALTVEAEATPREPVWRCALEMLWAGELAMACDRLKISRGPRSTRAHMIAELLRIATPSEIQREICAGLRQREAKWRADPALPQQEPSQ